MAFIWQSPNSSFWQAGFADANGRRRNRSTKVRIKGSTPTERQQNQRQALKIADSFEEAARTRKTVTHTRKTIMELSEELNGHRIIEKSLVAYLEDWLERKTPTVTRSTLEAYKAAVDSFVEFMAETGMDQCDLIQVSRDHIIKHRNSLALRLAPKTVNRHIRIIRSAFTEAKRDSLIPENPAEFVDAVKSRREVARRPFTSSELQQLLAVADDEWRSMILFGFYTGLRIGDIVNLDWTNIDTKRGIIQVTTRKTGKTINAPICGPLNDHISELQCSDDPTQPLHPRLQAKFAKSGRANGICNEFADLLYEAGLRESKVSHRKKAENEVETGRSRKVHQLSFHCLRNTFITMLHEAGVAPAVVKEVVGHDSQSVHDGYIGVGQQALASAVSKLPKIN